MSIAVARYAIVDNADAFLKVFADQVIFLMLVATKAGVL